MALRLFRESVEWVALFGYRFKPLPQVQCSPWFSIAHKKAPPSRQRFYQSLLFFLSLHHSPQRFQFGLAEQVSGIALNHHPARIRFPDLTRSIGLQKVRDNLERFAVYDHGMQIPLADYVHFGVHFSALSPFVSG
jgi:hypothetical protein